VRTAQTDGTIALTDSATAKIAELIQQEGNPHLALRVAVQPGGCSGFSYEMFFDSDLADDDVISAYGDVKVVVDPTSANLLTGATLDFKEPSRRRAQHQQPQREPHLRLRTVIQLIQPTEPILRCPGVRRSLTMHNLHCRTGPDRRRSS
jgi:iron-sulfur cluster assembly accessory protein